VKCGFCDEVIKGQYISALNKSWHPDHFVCTECAAPFEGNQFHKHDDKPYCEKHYNQLFSENCVKCGRPIEGEIFEALERKYHLACFTCCVGDHKIGEGINFHWHDDNVYCQEHFAELFLQKCAGCGSVIKGQYIKVLDAHYHPGCWKCATCQTAINSDNCAQANGKFYCQNCVGKAPAGGGGAKPVSVPKAAAYADVKRPAAASVAVPAAAHSAPGGAQYYSYEALVDKNLPAGVDPARKEDYLSDEVFMKMFNMDRASFEKLPLWKRKRIKQKAGLA